jgi:hypothetical protein
MKLAPKLNGVKYVKVEIFANKENGNKIKAKIKRYDAIYQGVKEFNNGGAFKSAYAILEYLVPEKNVAGFNSDKD